MSSFPMGSSHALWRDKNIEHYFNGILFHGSMIPTSTSSPGKQINWSTLPQTKTNSFVTHQLFPPKRFMVNRPRTISSDFPSRPESPVTIINSSHTLYCEFWRAVLSLVVIGSESVCPISKSETQLDLFVLIDAVPAETRVELLSLLAANLRPVFTLSSKGSLALLSESRLP